MNQHYSSSAIYSADEPPSSSPSSDPAFDRERQDPTLYHTPSTIPGRRLPHAWLNAAVPSASEAPVSTIDLAGHGHFTLLTGIGGACWKIAAQKLSNELGVEIKAYSIGWGQDWEDGYFEWAGLRGVGEDGCVLVRPDRFVAWRAKERLAEEEAGEKLATVMRSILGLK